jgi:phosphopantothenoylcysteine decarboxylase/phosphopantothenate--cysteine ligase
MSKGNILFQLSGSIACYKSCFAISRLVQDGYTVEVVATPSALKFVGEATLEGLISGSSSGSKIHTDAFESGKVMSHIHLIRWADLIVLAPASANTLGKMASGMGDDLVTTLFLAHDFKKPYLIAPAMNVSMYRHPALQGSIAKLKEWGVTFLETGTGNLACGEVGEGRLIEPEQLVLAIEKHWPRPLTTEPQQILITAGGTREPIDGVRFITNLSSGRTGATLANELAAYGHKVVFAHSEGSVTPDATGIEQKSFTTFNDLRELLKSELGARKFDVVIHAAAVGDYSVDSIQSLGKNVARCAKIDSGENLTLNLKANPKIVDEIRGYSRNSEMALIAFKLTDSTDPQERRSAVAKLAQRSKADWIVHNDLSGVSSSNAHSFSIYDGRSQASITEVQSKTELASELERLIRLRSSL